MCSWLLSTISKTLFISVFLLIPLPQLLYLPNSTLAERLPVKEEVCRDPKGDRSLMSLRRDEREPDMRPRLNSSSIQMSELAAVSVIGNNV